MLIQHGGMFITVVHINTVDCRSSTVDYTLEWTLVANDGFDIRNGGLTVTNVDRQSILASLGINAFVSHGVEIQLTSLSCLVDGMLCQRTLVTSLHANGSFTDR
jgi:hypothetical protein